MADGTILQRLPSTTFNPTTWPLRYHIGVIGLIGLGFAPMLINDPLLVLALTAALYFAMFAMSWDIVSGYTGQFSFGHSFIFALGGYSSALASMELGMSIPVSVVTGTLTAIVGGFILGAPALRLKGPYFAILTFLLPSILQQVFILYSDIFGGQQGLAPPETIFAGASIQQRIDMNYYLAFGLFVVILGLLLLITRSTAGTILTAVREDEELVSASGFNPTKYKILAFVVSAGVGGLASAVFVHTMVGAPQPSQLLTLTVSINVILATILAGIGRITGAAVGGIFYYMLRDFIGDIEVIVPVLSNPIATYDIIIFSLIVLVIIYYLPEGLVPYLVEQGRKLQSRVNPKVSVNE